MIRLLRCQIILLGFFLAADSMLMAADEQRWETIVVPRSFNGQPFSYRMKLLQERQGYRIYKLYYPSPMTTPVEQNNTIPAEYFLPDGVESEGDSPIFALQKSGQSPRPAVICLHILDGNEALTDLVCSTLAQRGIPAIMFKLPYYGQRALPEGPIALAKDPKLFAGAIAQAAQDVRRTIDVLESRPEVDPAKIGITGISLGGLVAATAAGGEPRIARAGLMLAGGDLQKIIGYSWETRPIRKMIDALPPEERRSLDAALAEVDPLRFADALRPRAAEGRVLMINAAEDEVIPRPCTEKLAAALGMEKKVVWLEGLGHYTAMAELPRAMKITADFFSEDLPPGAAPPPKAREKTPIGRLAGLLRQLGMLLSDEPQAGRCHCLELEFTTTLPDQKPISGRFRYARGCNHQFVWASKLPILGETGLGQGRFPWVLSGEKTVLEGTLHPEAELQDPLALADRGQVARLKMFSGLLGSVALAPGVLQRFLVLTEESAADGGGVIRVSTRDDLPRGDLRLLFDAEGKAPKRLEFEILGTRGTVEIRDWRVNAAAEGTLFQPPAEKNAQAVEQAEVYRIFARLFNAALMLMQ
jgi:dienelactone hydrolase